MRTCQPLLLAALLLLLPSAAASAYEVGDQVVVVNAENGIRDGDTVIDKPPLGDALTVREVRGVELRVSRGKPGWIWAREVAPLESAARHFTLLLERDGDLFTLYAARALVHMELEDFDASLEDFDKAMEISPGAWLYHNRGITYSAMGNERQAIRDFDRSIELDGGTPNGFRARGGSYRDLGEYRRALRDFEEAIRLDPANAKSFFGRGETYDLMGEYEKALADYATSISLDSEFPIAHNNLAWMLATCPLEEYRDGQRALEHARVACELSDWKDAHYVDTLASASAEVGDFESAVRYQQQAIELDEEGQIMEQRQECLSLYQQRLPYREPIPEDIE